MVCLAGGDNRPGDKDDAGKADHVVGNIPLEGCQKHERENADSPVRAVVQVAQLLKGSLLDQVNGHRPHEERAHAQADSNNNGV